jgi:hypothetical protein
MISGAMGLNNAESALILIGNLGDLNNQTTLQTIHNDIYKIHRP